MISTAQTPLARQPAANSGIEDTMARRARMIVAGAPRHVTQRGNRREPIFLQLGEEAIGRRYSAIDIMSPKLRSPDRQGPEARQARAETRRDGGAYLVHCHRNAVMP